MKTDKDGCYYITVEFRRDAGEDREYIERLSREQNISQEAAAKQQFIMELQEAYDASCLAGFFEVLGEVSDTPKAANFQPGEPDDMPNFTS